MYHRKRLVKCNALHELESLAVADQIDPEDKWHIGHAIIETTDEEEIWTLKFKYGGKSLNHLHRESSETILLVLRGIVNIMDGLIQLHSHNLYHRDVKLNNILYDNDGVVRLIDFGTAITSLPDTEVDNLYDNIYTIWPFETQLLNGRPGSDCFFSDNIYGEYVNEPYYQPIRSLHELDPSEFRANAISLKRKFHDKVQLHREITKRIDVYSLGISLSHLLCKRSVRESLNPVQYESFKALCRKMIEPYTLERISVLKASLEYQGIWQN
jgi:serine/threonine protein kinase